jgi:2-octaprenylphenol hydroxylase
VAYPLTNEGALMHLDYDVIIVGGGLVGMVLAAFLAEQDLKIALIETGEFKPVNLEPDCYQLRVSAINLACEEMFKTLGMWRDISASLRLSAFEKMRVWDSLGRGEIQFDCVEIASSKLGYILENAVIYNALLKKLNTYSNLKFIDRTQPFSLAIHKNSIEIKLSSKEGLTTQLIVGADGANSWVRHVAHIECYQWPYHHEALVTTVETEYEHQKTAWQCFLPEGPLALLPLYEDHICSVVWSVSPNEMIRLLQLSEAAFNLEITHAFEYRLGKIKKLAQHATFPLFMRHAKNYVTDRVVLMGDAAHSIHPLAGQGINLGFADACSLAEKIIQSKAKTKDCGNYLWLRKYERARKADNWMMTWGMEFFKKLFENQSAAIIYFRSLGLNFVNKAQLIKNQFAYKARG